MRFCDMSPILTDSSLDFISHSAEQTTRLGTRLGELLRPGDLICLEGGLGAGKTAMAAGIARGWGAVEPVSSPTFVLVHEHTRLSDSTRLHHVDCYRLSGVDELWTIGFDDIISGRDIVVIEWPERIMEALPGERLWIRIEVIEATRRLLWFEATGDRYRELLEAFRHSLAGGR